jgi:hypothetical protein
MRIRVLARVRAWARARFRARVKVYSFLISIGACNEGEPWFSFNGRRMGLLRSCIIELVHYCAGGFVFTPLTSTAEKRLQKGDRFLNQRYHYFPFECNLPPEFDFVILELFCSVIPSIRII